VRKAIIITVLVIATLGVAAWLVTNRAGKRDLTAWQVVPPNTLAVIETEQPRVLQRVDADSAGMISALLGSDSVNRAPEPWLFTIHSIGKKTGMAALLKRTKGGSPIELAKKAPQATVKERVYEGVQITDVLRGNQPWLSIAQHRGIWIISSHAVIVEEIIRHARSETEQSFRKNHSRIFQLSNVKQDDGNLYINWTAFREGTAKNQAIEPILRATALSDAMLFDLRWSNNTLLMNGFAVDSTSNASLLSVFRAQKPVPFTLKTRLPDQFRYFVHFGISNPSQWHKDRSRHMSEENIDAVAALKTLETTTGFKTADFFKGVDNELALCALPSGEHLVVAELKEITRVTSELNKINTAAAKNSNYSHESYANEEIHIIRQSSLSQTLFWPLSFDTQDLYYVVTDNLLVLSDGEQGLKKFIDNMNGESTLSKSLEWNKFLESTLPESNVSYFVSTGNESLFGSLRQPQKFSMQFYALEGDYYASAVAQFGKGPEKRTVNNIRTGNDFGQGISRAPLAVVNHTDRSNEVVVVDNANKMHLLSKDQKVLWTTELPGPVQGNIYQVDILKNGKLQYLLVTSGKIHVIDRLGRYVPGYPKAVELNDANMTSLIDYDNTRNYRLLLANSSGKIVVCDLEGRPLEGWKLKSLPREFSDAPSHFRIRQRDYYVALTVHGDLFIFNRRGDINEGFPLSLGFTPLGDVASDGKNVFMVSNDGTLAQISTQGKRVSIEALPKKAANAAFRLVKAYNNDNFVVVKTEQGYIAAFDSSTKQLFEINNPASDNIEVVLYHTSDNRDVLAVFDKEQNLFYATDLAGKLLIPQPLQASAMPAMTYQQNTKTITFYVPDQSRILNVSATL
jgi:hypothetical protein